MSPIPSIATTFALPTPAPSVTLDSTRQGTPLMSQYILGTGSFLVAVALVLVARCFHHGRGIVNHTRTSNTWVPWTGLLSTRRRSSPTDWPVDVEVGFELDVRIVYVGFSHPAIWNLVECHPGTPSVPDLSPSGVDSFLDMVDRVGRHEVKEVPMYDTSSPTSVSFSSEITGTTVREGAFLSVLGELEDDPSETSPSNSEPDFPGAPCDGISTVDSELDLGCSPCDAISTTDSESRLSCSPDDGIVVTPPRSSYGPCTRRHGVVDMTYFAQSKDTISEEGYPLVPAIPRRAGLLGLSSFIEMDSILPCGSESGLAPADEESTTAHCDIGVHDTPEALVDGSDDVNIPGAPHSGGALMRLRDPDLDCTPRSLSEDSDPEYSSDDDEDGASVPYPAPPLFLRNARRSSLESIFTPGTNSEVSDEGPIYPSTPSPSLPLLGLGLTFPRSPYRHQLWAPIFRCQSRDTSALARTTVRYSMVRRSFWRAEIACEIAVPRPYPL